MFASALPESLMAGIGKIHKPRPLAIKTRKELLTTIKPQHRRFLRADNGETPEVFAHEEAEGSPASLRVRGQKIYPIHASELGGK